MKNTIESANLDGNVVVACAMKEEIAPFLEAASSVSEVEFANHPSGLQAYRADLWGKEVLLLRTGIGLTNAAVAATLACQAVRPSLYILAGTIGGLAADVSVGQVIIGTSARYFDADATAFGYQPGQIPQMPAQYESGDWAQKLPGSADVQTIASGGVGLVLSGNSFVTGQTTSRVRETFVGARGADMETCAAAQVCASFAVPWLCVRAVSDLCGPAAGQQFHIEADQAAAFSSQAVQALLS